MVRSDTDDEDESMVRSDTEDAEAEDDSGAPPVKPVSSLLSGEQLGQRPCRYKLRGAVLHRGRSAYNGHYVTDIWEDVAASASVSASSSGRVPSSGKWKRYDDQYVSELSKIDSERDRMREAYLVFYELIPPGPVI
eukprot:gb/GEZN01020979.1/.p1 GENE.gb/GEZN01020979.1/~~gb/GEZN01020979.1/.p1  ORF type:complete len:156 (-),score=25.99 gb/GEZN01020979.1/:198-605(-)